MPFDVYDSVIVRGAEKNKKSRKQAGLFLKAALGTSVVLVKFVVRFWIIPAFGCIVDGGEVIHEVIGLSSFLSTLESSSQRACAVSSLSTASCPYFCFTCLIS